MISFLLAHALFEASVTGAITQRGCIRLLPEDITQWRMDVFATQMCKQLTYTKSCCEGVSIMKEFALSDRRVTLRRTLRKEDKRGRRCRGNCFTLSSRGRSSWLFSFSGRCVRRRSSTLRCRRLRSRLFAHSSGRLGRCCRISGCWCLSWCFGGRCSCRRCSSSSIFWWCGRERSLIKSDLACDAADGFTTIGALFCGLGEFGVVGYLLGVGTVALSTRILYERPSG